MSISVENCKYAGRDSKAVKIRWRSGQITFKRERLDVKGKSVGTEKGSAAWKEH
jgi:hypothetical protein